MKREKEEEVEVEVEVERKRGVVEKNEKRNKTSSSSPFSPACESTKSVTGMCDAKNRAATIEPGRLERGRGAGGIAKRRQRQLGGMA